MALCIVYSLITCPGVQGCHFGVVGTEWQGSVYQSHLQIGEVQNCILGSHHNSFVLFKLFSSESWPLCLSC